ncbi:MAG: hypothetical protein ACTSVI_17115 [Promethearchaeota archaeon]
MPKGVIIIKWDEKKGPLLLDVYPDNLTVNNSLLGQVYAGHRAFSLESGYSSFSNKDNKIISFFSGMKGNIIGKPNHVLALVYRKDESISGAKKILEEFSEKVLSSIDSGEYRQILFEIYERMKS